MPVCNMLSCSVPLSDWEKKSFCCCRKPIPKTIPESQSLSCNCLYLQELMCARVWGLRAFWHTWLCSLERCAVITGLCPWFFSFSQFTAQWKYKELSSADSCAVLSKGSTTVTGIVLTWVGKLLAPVCHEGEGVRHSSPLTRNTVRKTATLCSAEGIVLHRSVR